MASNQEDLTTPIEDISPTHFYSFYRKRDEFF